MSNADKRLTTDELTLREREICELVLRRYTNAEIASACGISTNTVRNRLSRVLLKGCTNPDIARALGISANTVRNHLSRLFAARNVTTRTELASSLMGVLKQGFRGGDDWRPLGT